MITNSYANASYNAFNYSFKTSSGDTINLAMYDNKELAYSSKNSKNSSEQSLNLRHAYGYKFELNSQNGISAQDKLEIAKALEELRPKIDDFMKHIKENEPFSDETISNIANSLKKELPNLNSDDAKIELKSSLLDMFDEMLKEHKTKNNNLNKSLLEQTQKLFENMLKPQNNLNYYA
ncbi:ATP/GTP-binding protein [Campylobacter devanensis]|uniref:ATP/GTP-binding protein n=1 Tax=Campylobacter devanensis TaxID=3161138 RepID=UPI000A3467A9|nr:ATP/GTP-binding protein [Campylobacter sp. P0222]